MLPAGIAGIGVRQPLYDGEAVAVGLKRAGKVALRHQRVADFHVRNREIELPARVGGIADKQIHHDLMALLGGRERTRRITDRQ